MNKLFSEAANSEVEEQEGEAPQDLTPKLGIPSSILGEYEHILLVGRGGSGKTFTAGTAPEPQWWLTPGGANETKTLLSPDFIKKHGRKEFHYTEIFEARVKGQMVDNPPGYDLCCDAVDKFLEWNYAKGIGVKTIIVDNATRIEEFMMNKAIYAEFMLAGNKEKTVLTQERKLGIRKPHDSTFGGAQSFMDRFANWLLELPFHVIFVAHTYETYTSDEQRGKKQLVSIQPLFVGQQRINIPNKFDNVWYSTTMGGGRSQTWGIQPQRDEVVDAKTRVGGILDPTYERDPDITNIIQRFKTYATQLEENDR